MRTASWVLILSLLLLGYVSQQERTNLREQLAMVTRENQLLRNLSQEEVVSQVDKAKGEYEDALALAAPSVSGVFAETALWLEYRDFYWLATLLKVVFRPFCTKDQLWQEPNSDHNPIWTFFRLFTGSPPGLVGEEGEPMFTLPTVLFLLLAFVYFSWLSRCCMTEYKMYQRLITRAETSDGFDTQRYSFSNFVAYRVDYFLTTVTSAKPIALGSITLLIITLGGFFQCLVKRQSLGAAMWESWVFVIDAGAHADEDDVSARVSALILTTGGVFVFALLLGLVSESIADKLDSLRHGEAAVLETGHVLVLGWSDKLIPMLKELALAAESEGGGVVVILADKEKEDMENELAQASLDLLGTTVVCRKGHPHFTHDLAHVSAKTAKSVIVLSPTAMTADEADGWALRVVLCVKGAECTGHVVVELQDIDNEELLMIVGGDLVEVVVAHDFIGRLIIQSGRQAGLAEVLEAVFGFGGDEFYMQRWPALTGKPFREVMFQFALAIPIGVITADGLCILNPNDDYILEEGDEVVVFAEDDDTYEPAEEPFVTLDILYEPASARSSANMAESFVVKPKTENILMVGWRRDLVDVLLELDRSVEFGSQLTIYCAISVDEREERLEATGREPLDLTNMTLTHAVGSAISRRELEKLPIEDYSTVFVLHEEDMEEDPTAADGRTLTSLFLLRDIWTRRKQTEGTLYDADGIAQKFSIISEVLDPRTRGHLLSAGVKDYVMSNEVVSAALAMVAEQRAVNKILKELLSSEGHEIYLRTARDYVASTKERTFWEMMVIVRACNHILVGYQLAGTAPILNPKERDIPIKWTREDLLIVLALN